MTKIRRRIISGTIMFGCALFTLYGASRIAEKNDNAALPVSIVDMDKEVPTIILDAGHGEST